MMPSDTEQQRMNIAAARVQGWGKAFAHLIVDDGTFNIFDESKPYLMRVVKKLFDEYELDIKKQNGQFLWSVRFAVGQGFCDGVADTLEQAAGAAAEYVADTLGQGPTQEVYEQRMDELEADKDDLLIRMQKDAGTLDEALHCLRHMERRNKDLKAHVERQKKIISSLRHALLGVLQDNLPMDACRMEQVNRALDDDEEAAPGSSAAA